MLDRIRSLSGNARRRLTTISVMAFVFALNALPAFATSHPTTPSAVVTDGFTKLKDEIFAILPVAIGGLVVFMAIRVGLKYLNKAARKA